MKTQSENKMLKKYLVELEIGNEIWIDSIQSNLYRVNQRTFLISLYDIETDKFISHTILQVV